MPCTPTSLYKVLIPHWIYIDKAYAILIRIYMLTYIFIKTVSLKVSVPQSLLINPQGILWNNSVVSTYCSFIWHTCAKMLMAVNCISICCTALLVGCIHFSANPFYAFLSLHVYGCWLQSFLLQRQILLSLYQSMLLLTCLGILLSCCIGYLLPLVNVFEFQVLYYLAKWSILQM
jgi:hypothetical protein